MPQVLYQIDAFSPAPFQGNPAGVVLSAEGLTEAQMQAVARELNNSETAFVLPPEGADHDVRVRFFTPTTEVPTCGHATVAAHYARAVEYGWDCCTIR
ncbi:PhzF family phenazine biosynthesis isomerase [Streptomyces sp. NPDC057067]|uniref:PhzF family phenazine biosynthesis isomerase n=1 Tax=unclassified Streptomyces TaxID=2593676 RepID=UPI00362767FB